MELSEVQAKLNDLLTDSHRPRDTVTIALCGVFSAGKSSILNALLQRELLPVGINPVTKFVTRVCYGGTLRFFCITDCGQKLQVDEAAFRRMAAGTVPLPEGGRELLVELPADLLSSGVVFLDTPGFLDEMGSELEEMSRRAALEADLVIFCCSAVQLGHEFERAYIRELEQTVGNFFLVVNRMDSLYSIEDQEEVRQVAAQMMDDRGGRAVNQVLRQNVFFTVAAGPYQNTDQLLARLQLALPHPLFRAIMAAERRKALAFRQSQLKQAISRELELRTLPLNELLKKHQDAKSRLSQQNQSIALSNSHRRNTLGRQLQAQLSQALSDAVSYMDQLVEGNEVQDFQNKAEQYLKNRCMAVAGHADHTLGAQGQLIEKIWAEVNTFSVPEPRATFVRRRTLAEAATVSLVKVMLNVTLEPGQVLHGRDVYAIGRDVYAFIDYQKPAQQKVMDSLAPRLRALLGEALLAYQPHPPVSEETGFEDALVQAREEIQQWQWLYEKTGEQNGWPRGEQPQKKWPGKEISKKEYKDGGTIMEKKMNLRFQKRPNDHFVHEERLVQWLDPDTGEIARQPQPEKKKVPRVGFMAGGKLYPSTAALLHKRLDGEKNIFRDIYGRTVVMVSERYPCFDSFDYANENRYFRWLYLRNGNRLTCVYYGDDSNNVEITEDAAHISGTAWRSLIRNGVVTEGEFSCLILDGE